MSSLVELCSFVLLQLSFSVLVAYVLTLLELIRGLELVGKELVCLHVFSRPLYPRYRLRSTERSVPLSGVEEAFSLDLARTLTVTCVCTFQVAQMTTKLLAGANSSDVLAKFLQLFVNILDFANIFP